MAQDQYFGFPVTDVCNLSGDQTITGTKTLSSPPVLTGGLGTATGGTAASNLVHTGGMPARVSTDGTNQTPVATEFYYAQVFVPVNMSITGIAVMNGAAVSGNMKVGLFDRTGALVASSATTAQSGTDAYQRVPFTAPYSAIGPHTYYAAVFVDNNTARLNAHAFGDFRTGKATGQVYATGFTAIIPATTFTADIGPIASLY